jgi:hypothetical protein
MSLDEPKLALNLAIAGALAGSITFTAMVLFYRRTAVRE